MPSRCRGGIAEERSNPQPMMNGMEKYRLGNSSCEVGEQRDACPGGADGAKDRSPRGIWKSQRMRRTQDRQSVSQAADRIRQFVQREPGVRLTALLHGYHRLTRLRWAFFEMKKNAARRVWMA